MSLLRNFRSPRRATRPSRTPCNHRRPQAAARRTARTLFHRRGSPAPRGRGRAALPDGYALVERTRPDLVLLDLNLPDQSGAALAAGRYAPHGSHVRILDPFREQRPAHRGRNRPVRAPTALSARRTPRTSSCGRSLSSWPARSLLARGGRRHRPRPLDARLTPGSGSKGAAPDRARARSPPRLRRGAQQQGNSGQDAVQRTHRRNIPRPSGPEARMQQPSRTGAVRHPSRPRGRLAKSGNLPACTGIQSPFRKSPPRRRPPGNGISV